MNKKRKEEYFPPQYIKRIIQHEDRNGINNAELRDYFRNLMTPGYVTKQNYITYFRNCIWLEDEKNEEMMKKYDMKNVTMAFGMKSLLQLKIPGLAERKPTLIPGDLVKITLSNYGTTYKGTIEDIEDNSVFIEIDNNLTEIIEDSPKITMDLSFKSGRVLFKRAQQGLERIQFNDTLKSLFPDDLNLNFYEKSYIIEDTNFLNKSVIDNIEQKTAVQNILNCSSKSAPFILFGPPGTGKTVTIVEAVVQIKMRTQKHILICAPSNAACDMLASKLIPYCKKTELVRIHSMSRDTSTVSKNIMNYSLTNADASDLDRFRIVVSTLMLIGKFGGKRYNPDVLVVDEAAQATETDICVALGVLNHGGQIVLAGDPKQLGPIVQSITAEKYGFNTSLMERLMNTQKIYQNHRNPKFIIMLKNNFRSHPKILEIPNRLFYNSELKALAEKPMEDVVSRLSFHPNVCLLASGQIFGNKVTLGQALEFCAVFGEEEKEGLSASCFNSAEANMVLQYVKTLVGLQLENAVIASDIGVIAPYIRQVHKIRDLLKDNGLGKVEVGSTESFQGREKRIIIISTVRSHRNLGFVKDEKRFNVAVTRAISKLIIIGSPTALSTDTKWKGLMDTCKTLNTYYKAYKLETDDIIEPTESKKNIRNRNRQTRKAKREALLKEENVFDQSSEWHKIMNLEAKMKNTMISEPKRNIGVNNSNTMNYNRGERLKEENVLDQSSEWLQIMYPKMENTMRISEPKRNIGVNSSNTSNYQREALLKEEYVFDQSSEWHKIMNLEGRSRMKTVEPTWNLGNNNSNTMREAQFRIKPAVPNRIKPVERKIVENSVWKSATSLKPTINNPFDAVNPYWKSSEDNRKTSQNRIAMGMQSSITPQYVRKEIIFNQEPFNQENIEKEEEKSKDDSPFIKFFSKSIPNFFSKIFKK